MRKDIADRWVAELRSGKYEQGMGNLNRDGKFCCLGVLCEMAVQEGVTTKVDAVGLTPPTVRYGVSNPSAGILPFDVVKWADMRNQLGEWYEGITLKGLAAMNDNGMSFEEIANVIEENWEKL